jgi:hypothetical protein
MVSLQTWRVVMVFGARRDYKMDRALTLCSLFRPAIQNTSIYRTYTICLQHVSKYTYNHSTRNARYTPHQFNRVELGLKPSSELRVCLSRSTTHDSPSTSSECWSSNFRFSRESRHGIRISGKDAWDMWADMERSHGERYRDGTGISGKERGLR